MNELTCVAFYMVVYERSPVYSTVAVFFCKLIPLSACQKLPIF